MRKDEKRWKIQVCVNKRWKDVHAPGELAYLFESQKLAEDMMNLCYPDQVREEKLGGNQTVRVVEASDRIIVAKRRRHSK